MISAKATEHAKKCSVVFTDTEYSERLRAEVDLVDHVFVCYVLAHEVESYVHRLLLCSSFDLFVHSTVEVFECQRDISPAFVPWDLYILR